VRPRHLYVGALALAAVLLCAPAAWAHTELLSSTPKDGARLAHAPHTVTLTYSEPVDPDEVSVTVDGRKSAVSVPDPHRPQTVAVSPSGVRSGELRLVWRVIDEEDGHATSGSLSFHIGSGSGSSSGTGSGSGSGSGSSSSSGTGSSSDSGSSSGSSSGTGTGTSADAGGSAAGHGLSTAVRGGLVAARWTGYLALALFAGGLGFLGALWPQGTGDRRTRVLLTLSWAAGLLSTVASVLLQASYAAMDLSVLLTTDVGITLAARALLWLLATVVLAALLQGGQRAARSPGWRVGAGVVCLGMLRTVGMAGHDAEGSHPGWGAVADLVHLTGVCLWIGGLTLLLIGVLPRRRVDELGVVVPRYSTLAAVSVTAIAAAGVVLAWQVVGSFEALLHTSYGHLLLIKLALLTVVLLAAWRSRSWVRTRLDIAVLLGGDRATVRPFVRSVAAETALVLAVLVATSLLVTANPGR
jgi:copper transport protein